VEFLPLLEAEGLNNRTLGSRVGTFYRRRNTRKPDSGQKRKSARNTDRLLHRFPPHSRNYHKKNAAFYSPKNLLE
jgi:hypothetical protein